MDDDVRRGLSGSWSVPAVGGVQYWRRRGARPTSRGWRLFSRGNIAESRESSVFVMAIELRRAESITAMPV
jgi:hypothetical protein